MRKYLIIIIIGIWLVLCYTAVQSDKDAEYPNPHGAVTLDEESAEQTGHSNKCVRPLKGRPFQELVDLSEKLNSILFCTKLKSEKRADILLANEAPMEYADLLEMARSIDYCEKQQCDGPCFAAI